MKNKHSKKWLLVIVTVILLIFLGVYGFTFWYLQNNIKNTRYELSKAHALEGQQSTFDNAEHALHDVSSSRDIVDASFIASDGEVAFINSIESLAKSIGLDITTQDVAFSQPIHNSYGRDLEITIITSGSWRANVHFIELIETLPFHIVISQTILTKQSSVLQKGDEKKPSEYWQSVIHFSVRAHPEI